MATAPRPRLLRVLPLLLVAACVDQPTVPEHPPLPRAALLQAGVTRVWTGAVSTGWSSGQNWSGGVAPGVQDTVVIPTAVPRYPVLIQNISIGGVTVQDGATLDLGAFDLTVSGNVEAGVTGGIVSTAGRLILAGTARTVQGRLPRMRVTGTYSLTGDVTAKSPVVVAMGRLRDSGWRIDARPPDPPAASAIGPS
jgi:hypothetical protein